MNAKKAKLLRQVAGYKNQSKTPGVMDFPGVARMVKVPVFETRQVRRTEYIKLPLDTAFTKVRTKVIRMVNGRDGKPIMSLGSDGKPKFQLEALSKPGKLRSNEPKGVYRQLKKLVGRYGYISGLTAAAEAEGAAA